MKINGGKLLINAYFLYVWVIFYISMQAFDRVQGRHIMNRTFVVADAHA